MLPIAIPALMSDKHRGAKAHLGKKGLIFEQLIEISELLFEPADLLNDLTPYENIRGTRGRGLLSQEELHQARRLGQRISRDTERLHKVTLKILHFTCPTVPV